MFLEQKLFDKPIEGIINITKKNIKTGEVTKYPKQHNLLTDGFAWRWMYDSSLYFSSMYLKVGRGSASPQSSDTVLTTDNSTWYGSLAYLEPKAYSCVFESAHKFSYTMRYVIQASAEASGEFCELGIWCKGVYYNLPTLGYSYRDQLITHSLLKDAEGHPYSITKTDLDQITIEYTLNFESQALNFLSLLLSFNAGNNSGSDSYLSLNQTLDRAPWSNSFVSTCSFTDIISEPMIIGNDIFSDWAGADYNTVGRLTSKPSIYMFRTSDGKVEPSNISNCLDGAQKKATIPVRRLPAKWSGNGRYILGIFFGPQSESSYGYKDNGLHSTLIDIKSAGLFTSATLEDYSVGSGDGSITDFTAPIPYWKQNTEKIYVNDVLQTRGVDYTCDNKHNLQNLVGLLPLSHSLIIDSTWKNFYESWGSYIASQVKQPGHAYVSFSRGSGYENRQMAHGAFTIHNVLVGDNKHLKGGIKSTGLEFSSTHPAKVAVCSTEHPTTFMLPVEKTYLDWTINEVYLWLGHGNNSYYKYDDFFFNLYCSNDNETWTKVLDHVTGYKSIEDGRADASRPWSSQLSEWCHYDLGSDYTTKYWKIELVWDNPTPNAYKDIPDGVGLILRRKGSPIHFTTAPAVDAVIKMDADTDLLYKDEKHVIDVGTAYTFN